MKRRYRHLADGEVRQIKGRRGAFPHKIMCCDCGLVHDTLFRVTGPTTAKFAAWRDNRATAAARRRKRPARRLS